MIDKIKSLQEIISSRFNNIIIASVALSSAMMNSRGILIFICSDKEARLSILKSWKLDITNDLIIPIIIASFYIVVIPWVSAILKKHITNKVYKREQDAERDKLLISLSGMQEVAVATAKSTSEYAEKYATNEIQTWLSEREQTLTELQSLKETNSALASSNEDLSKNQSNLISTSEYYSMLYERCISSINNLGILIQEFNHQYPSEHADKNSHNIWEQEHKFKLAQQLANAIKYMFEINNNRPTSTHGEWKPPINATSTEQIASLLTKLADEKARNDLSMQNMLNAIRTGGRDKTTNVKGSDGK